MTTTLYGQTADLAARFDALSRLLDESDGELDQALLAELEALELAQTGVIETLVRLIHRHAARADGKAAEARAMKEQAEAVSKSAEAAKNRVALLKGRILNYLESTGQKSVEAGPYTVRWQNNGSPSVLSVPPARDLPERFQVTRVEVNRQALSEAFMKGEIMPDGVVIERGKHLRIQ